MTLELEITPEAESDLLQIWLYIADDQPVNADRYLDKIQEKASRLAEFPELGRERDELSVGLRCFPVDRYNLYYLITETKLYLVRVLPADRDINQIF